MLGLLSKKKAPEFYVICDNLRSLYNIGSIFRTADALGVNKIYLTGICGTPEQKGLKKVALGAEESVPWEYAKNTWQLVDKLKKQKVKIIALELNKNSVDIDQFVRQNKAKMSGNFALILGNEVTGVSSTILKRSDVVVHIPMKGMKESLNVSVAFGIAGYMLAK